MYLEDKGVAQNDKKARSWTEKSEKQGHAYAQRSLGAMYYNGLGVNQDDGQAMQWY